MKKERQKISIVILLLIVVFTSNILAGTYSGGNGTAVAPYQINTTDDLSELVNTIGDWGTYFIQTADIDLSSISGNFGVIGNDTTSFTGSYNGQDFTINGLTNLYTGENDDYIGFFGGSDGATIKNVNLTNVKISGHRFVGGLVGYVKGTTLIEDCSATGSVEGVGTDSEDIGGLVGATIAYIVNIKNSYSECTVTFNGIFAIGGFIGRNSGTITNCYSTGNVGNNNSLQNFSYWGGFVGRNSGTISTCFATGDVVGSKTTGSKAGGFVGHNYRGNIELCYATGNVSNAYEAGGFVGSCLEFSPSINVITKSYSSGNVSAIRYAGGFVGRLYESELTDCYSLGDVAKPTVGGDSYAGFCGNIDSGAIIKHCYSTGAVYYTPGTDSTDKGFVGTESSFSGSYDLNFFNTTTSNQTTATGATGKNNDAFIYDETFTTTILSSDTKWDIYNSQGGPTSNNNYWEMVAGINSGYPFIRATYSTTTKTPTSITANSATCGGNVFDSGSRDVTERGICWSTSTAPTTSNLKVTVSGTTGSFTANITGLSEGTTYYVRAYVTNNVGTTYGDDEVFTTTQLAPSGSGTSGDPYLIENLDNLYWITQNNNLWDKYFKQIANIDATNSSSWDGGAGLLPIGDATSGNHFEGDYNGNGFEISNLTINRPSTDYVALFGYSNGDIYNLGLKNVSIIGKNYTGGLVGANLYGSVSECFVEGSVSGTSIVGGVAGYNYNTISKSYSKADITCQDDNGGGAVGYAYNGTVSKSYATGNVTGVNNSGGFVGSSSSTITNCYAIGNVTSSGDDVGGFAGENSSGGAIDNCYSVGTATGTNNGGFTGNNGGTIADSFWDTETSGTSTAVGVGTQTGVTGKTTVNMQTETTFTSAGWDYANIWDTNPGINSGYPNLEGAIAPTPVELTSFTAKVIGKSVVLNWQTATEVNNYGFHIERKSGIENREWKEIGFIEGHGNSNSPKEYSFVDTDVPVAERSRSYRLKQIDFDGAFEYHDVVTVELNGAMEYKLAQNHPNPFNPSTQIAFTIPSSGVVKLNVYNVLGEVVTELVNQNLEAGTHQYEFDASNLTSGIYFYSISVNGFTEVKKMNLVK